MSLILQLFILFQLLFSITKSLVPSSERNALVDLYQATNGVNWKQATNWNDGDPCDNKWFGIFCNPTNTHIIEVFPNPRLSGNKMIGKIPDSLWTDLPELEQLYLSNDRPPNWSNLTGTIPTAIGQLTNLKCLYLSHAGKMTGNLPSSMSNLIHLQGLFLRWTHFEGPLPDLSNSPNLTKLVIDGSPLKGLCPNICQQHFNGTLEQIGSWKNKLIHLDVAGNDFTGVFPASLCAIKECTAWGNQFDKPLRPKTCCAGLTNDEEMNVPIGYDCHPHNFPT